MFKILNITFRSSLFLECFSSILTVYECVHQTLTSWLSGEAKYRFAEDKTLDVGWIPDFLHQAHQASRQKEKGGRSG